MGTWLGKAHTSVLLNRRGRSWFKALQVRISSPDVMDGGEGGGARGLGCACFACCVNS